MKNKKYTEQINIRLTNNQLKSLNSKAEKCGLSNSNYLRKILFEKEPKFLSVEDRKEIDELKKIGLEMNRTLNLYHEKRTEHSPFFMKLRNVVSKFKS